MLPAPSPIPRPTSAGLTLSRAGGTLVLSAAFPTRPHLVEAAFAGVLLVVAVLMVVAAGMVRAGTIPTDSGSAPLIAGLALLTALVLGAHAMRRLGQVRPILVRLSTDGLTVESPPGVALSLDEASGLRRPEGGRREIRWAELKRVEADARGLVLFGLRRSLLIPWQYRRAAGFHARGTLTVNIPAYRFDELDWIAGLIERLRQGEGEALDDLIGRRPAGSAQPSAPVWEAPTFVLRGVGPARLHRWVVLVAVAVGLFFALRVGLIG